MAETRATVSVMETEAGRLPSPDEAKRTLREIDQAEGAVRYPPLPRWFFLVMAALVAGLALAQLLEPSDSSKATLALAVVALVLASRYWLNRDGVSWASVGFTDMVPFLLGILGTFAVSGVIAATTGASWAWVVGAVLAGAIVIRTGRTYRREFGG